MSVSRAAEAENEALLSFLYVCPVGLLRTSATGVIEMMNAEAAKLLLPLGAVPLLVNAFDALEAYAPELRSIAAAFSKPSGPICEQHRIFISSAGRGPRVLACTLVKVNPESLMFVLQDISKQVDQERQLRQNEAMFAALVAGVNDFALFSLDAAGNIDSWNLACERQTGFAAAEVIGQSLSILSLPGQARADDVAPQVADAVREGWSLRERWCARRDGSRYWCQIMVAAAHEADGDAEASAFPAASLSNLATLHAPISGFAVVLRDVTERHVTGEQLRRLLTTDSLTGAANRGHFFQVAESEITRHNRRGLPISLLMIDLDHFKRINDCYGHATGDAVLQRFVTVCRAQLRERDVIARMGGEEFAVLVLENTLEDAMRVADRIVRAVATEIALPAGPCLNMDPASLRPGVSIGCATLSDSMTGIDALLKAADRALYQAKSAGRGQARAHYSQDYATSPA